MTTTVYENSQTAWTWKLTTILLAILVALLGATAGLESYYLYNAHHQENVAQGDAATRKSAASARPDASPAELDVLLPLVPGVVSTPWDQLNALHQRMDQIFNDTQRQFPMDDAALISTIASPNLDVREEKDHYTVRADMPGVDKSSLKVNVEGRLLSIAGERTAVNETKADDKVVRSERSLAKFVRTIELPGPVKADSVDAKYDNGVLTLTLPKADEAVTTSQVPVH